MDATKAYQEEVFNRLSVEEKEQFEDIVSFLWENMKKDKDHKDRVVTGWGTKTKVGLYLSLRRIFKEG